MTGLSAEPASVLGHYPAEFQPARVEDLHGGGGFSGARLWKLHAPAGEFCLRVWPAGGLGRERLHGLHRLLRHVYAAGVESVSVPVATSAGTTVISLHGRYWQLEPWMPGQADFAGNPAVARLSAIMACLANWHRAAGTFQPQGNEARWFASRRVQPSPGIAERRAMMESWNRGRLRQLGQALDALPWEQFRTTGAQILQLFPQAAPTIARQLDAAAQLTVSLQPCLRDIWHDHVLLTGNEVTGLIDPGSCRTENIAADLARLLGSLFEDDHARWEFAMTAYEHIRPLSAAESGLVPVFDRSGVLLAGINWLDWVCFQHRPVADPGRIVARLQTIATRLRHLVEHL